jgi:hypothetical protein
MRITRLKSRPFGGSQPDPVLRTACPTQPSGLCARRPALSAALLAAALLSAALLAIAPPARADVGEAIILRCTHGQSLSGFSQSAYSQALKELSADAEEYTDCSSLIRQAQVAAAGGRGGGAAATAATPTPIAATPAEQRAITHASRAGSKPVRVGKQVIQPGVVHANIASALSSLPTPLLATLAFLLACLLLVVGGALRNRVRARRSD